jgi:hypothetical protein
MIYKIITVIGALALISPTAHAGSAPKELYGKSITVAWSETFTHRFEFDRQVRNGGTSRTMNIYISTAGRPFVRVVAAGFGSFNVHQSGLVWSGSTLADTETSPGETATKDHVAFEGRSIVVYRQFRSGARRIAIEVDGMTCRATIIHGREGGKTIEKSFGGQEIMSLQVGSSVTCSIREGNVFGQ